MSKQKKIRKTDNSFVISYSPKTRQLIGSDAGSSAILDEKWSALQIHRRKNKSERSFKKAIKAHACMNDDMARSYMAEALEYGAKAYWWSENTPHQDELHDYIHLIAKWNHDNLGCYINYENGKYVHRCMIAYSHKRLGVSPGMYGDKTCSLCDQDLSICPHRTSRSYWVRGGDKNNKGECRICLKRKCSHDPKHLYRTKVIAHMANPILEEVSLVKYPVQPEMRMVSEFTYSVQDMMKRSGYKLNVGQRLLCHLCRDDCPGFDELENT